MPRSRKSPRKSGKSMQHICSGVKGVVKSLQHDRSYGFIREKDSGREVFFHISGLVLDVCHRRCREAWTCQDARPIRVGDEVKYELYLAPKGYRAESVRVLNVEPVLGDFNPDQFHDDFVYDYYDWSRGSTGPGPTSNHRVSGGGPRRGRGQRQNGQGSGDLEDWGDWPTLNQHNNSTEPEPQPQPRHPASSNGGRGKGKDTKPGTSTSSNPTSGWDHVKAEHKVKDWSDWSTENQHSSTGPGPEPQPQPRHPTCTCSNGGRGKVKDTKPETSTSSNPTSGWDHVKAEHTVRENTQPHVTPPNSTELSGSAKQRERGNIFYKSATEDFSATVRIIRLENAITCYKNALSCSSNRDDEASASKNIGMASWKLATIALESETEESEKRQQSILKHFKEALKFFCTAYVLRSYKSASWGDKLVESWENCLEEACEWLAMLDTAERVAGFSELLGYLPDCSLKANGYIQYSTLLFHEGLTAWQDGEYKECYRFMRECYFPVQEAERLCEGDCSIKSEIAVLQEDVYIHTCVAESSMARATGDDLLEEHLKNEETVNTNIIWTVIDFYTQAAMLCRDKDLEQEAIAYSRLGRVYGKVLTLPSRGKDYYKKAIQLALSMTPRTFHGVGWFMESTKFVEDFQKRLNKDEEEDKDKEAALEEMKEDVDRLSEMATNHGDLEFVKDIYKTWPPKAPGAKLNEKLSTKKLLLKAISHYHPDKVDKEVHGKNWFYFSGEITRHLNSKYACQKGVE
eukprot:XP_011663282.1 PREDICTED: uncharacterized protein LOC100890018 isoform X1 [Strongylocentrotus purpuratus]